jgi:2-iminobutanoate/2-iminopropanoate deaminase
VTIAGQDGAGAPLRWLTVTLPDDLAGAVNGLRSALGAVGLEPADVVHLKLWTPSVVTASELPAEWLTLFPDQQRRPCLSLIPSDPGELVITVAAHRGSEVRSWYEPGQTEREFPGAASAGDYLFVAALVPRKAQGDARAQSEELFGRLRAILDLAGASPNGLGHLFVWYQDHSVRDVINDPYLALFETPGDRPARHSVVRELPPGTALMIEAAGSVRGVRSCYTVGGLWHGGIGGVPNSLPFGTRCGELLFSAGTYGRDPADGDIPDSLADQSRWALHYCREFLRVAGMTARDVGQVYVWVRHAADADKARAMVEEVFGTTGSATSIQVIRADLPGTNQIQVELVAQR